MKTISRFLALFAAVALAWFALSASAQTAGGTSAEPTVAQIYQAANTGNLDRANAMVEEVLKKHPGSARAHYVKAELAARGHHVDVAKQELATAEKIAPGLPFAKAESVQALRNQLSNAATPPAVSTTQRARQMGAPADTGGYRAQQEPAQPGFPWTTLILVVAVVGIGAMFLRRRQRAMEAAAPNYGGPVAAANDQQGYGPGPGQGPGPGYYAPPGAQPYPPGYAPPGYPPQQPSMGSSIARGVGTGLAVGAGVFAAQEIGRRMFDHGNANAASLPPDAGNHPTLDQIDDGMRHNLNTDMGGNDFGVADGGWDDAGGGDAGGGGGGGGDWDS